LDRDERGLARRCLQRDEDACAELVQQFAPMVGTVIWRATGDHQIVEDLAQETFLRVFRGLPYFDARAKLSTWIYTIAHRVAIDHLRQAGRWRGALSDDDAGVRLDTLPVDGTSPESLVEQDEMNQLVREHLAQLPDKYRLPLTYAAIDGLDHDVIGAMIGVQAGSVKTLVFRARQMLKARIMATLTARCRM
jgi:RNA polymerase sigma-70 factor (ECF subfamily)